MIQPARQTDIDTLRALACIALVSFHVVGYTPQSGMELPAGHPLHLLQAGLTPLRMPLFIFLSGVVFCTGVDRFEAVPRRLVSKARRLLLPLGCVGSLFWLTLALTGREVGPFGAFLWQPFAHFWYLQASFAIMGTALGLLALCHGRVVPAAMALAVLGLAGGALLPDWVGNPFAIRQAMVFAPFFAAGLVWRAVAMPALAGAAQERAVGLAMVSLAILTGYAAALEIMPLTRTGAQMVGILGCAGLMLAAPRHAGLARLGRSSYAVYLFHVFFTAGTLMGLDRFWSGGPVAAVYGLALVAGLSGPVMLERVLLAVPVLKVLCLGLRVHAPVPQRPARAPREALSAA